MIQYLFSVLLNYLLGELAQFRLEASQANWTFYSFNSLYCLQFKSGDLLELPFSDCEVQHGPLLLMYSGYLLWASYMRRTCCA